MGGAIACGLAQGHFTETRDIIVANPHNEKLQKLQARFLTELDSEAHGAAQFTGHMLHGAHGPFGGAFQVLAAGRGGHTQQRAGHHAQADAAQERMTVHEILPPFPRCLVLFFPFRGKNTLLKSVFQAIMMLYSKAGPEGKKRAGREGAGDNPVPFSMSA